jgi:tetratricopeptide (TPR) repeat protein
MESGCPVGGTHASEDTPPERRVESWKEIAAYFGRDVRTVRRWERNEGLPVHRHLHGFRGSVYAFQPELEGWLARRSVPVSTRAPAVRFGLSARVLPLLFGILLMVGLTGWAFFLTEGPAGPSRIQGPDRIASGGEPSEPGWTADPQVRERFLLARHQLERRMGNRREAQESLEATIQRAPTFAEAHALLGEAYLRAAVFDPRAGRAEAWRNAEGAVRQALALDQNLATAHAVLGRILLLRDWNWEQAAAETLRAIALDPDAVDARGARALYLRSSGRVAEAIAERAYAQRVDPLNPQCLIFLGDEYAFARRYEDARRAYEAALRLERDSRAAIAGLADVHARAGRYGDAAIWHVRSLAVRGRPEVATAFDAVRQRQGARAALVWLDRSNLEVFKRAPDEHAWDLAYTYARLGDRDAAFQFLQRAYDQRDSGLLQARVDPDLDPLRGDPRFGDLLKRIGP